MELNEHFEVLTITKQGGATTCDSTPVMVFPAVVIDARWSKRYLPAQEHQA